jgi:predicted KAP-like P-loop ATPase
MPQGRNTGMQIHPPKLTIDVNDPFKEALFGRQAFAESLTQLLRNVSEGLVIVVHAPWGEGKTTFAQMWQADLLRQKLNVVYFDAYAADYFADPFVCFSGEILDLAEKRLTKDKGLLERREFKKTAAEVGKRLVGLAANVALKTATLGILDQTHIKELKDISSELAKDIAKIGSETIEKKIENYTAEKDSLAAFKKSLTKLAAVVREEQGFPLAIIVDELDRCRPDFALALLERIILAAGVKLTPS